MKILSIIFICVLTFSNSLSENQEAKLAKVHKRMQKNSESALRHLAELRKDTNKVASDIFRLSLKKNPNGITLDDLRTLLKELAETGMNVPSFEKAKSLMDLYDENNDSIIQENEFQKLWFFFYSQNALEQLPIINMRPEKHSFLQLKGWGSWMLCLIHSCLFTNCEKYCFFSYS
jgi:hypothetical protein